MRATTARRPGLLLALTALVVAVAALIAAILARTGGTLVYSLDDPYIHLALAQQIAQGHYGLNAGEASAPSSSILWPLLLAPLTRLGVSWYAPLAINLAATAGIVMLIDGMLRLVVPATATHRELVLAAATATIILCTNVIGLAFTGMEHSLQVLLSLIALRGLITLATTARLPWWLGPALVLGPLVRYENLAVTAGAMLVLASQRRYGAMAWVTGATAVTLGAFSAFLVSQGLAPLPASVQAKAVLGLPLTIGGITLPLPVLENLLRYDGLLFLVVMLLLLARAVTMPRNHPERPLAMAVGVMALLHLCAGRFGWFQRYQIAAWAVAILGVLYLYRRPLTVARRWRGAAVAGALCAVALYAWPTLGTPTAASNVYRQQYQMSRLVAAYGQPVAANDIGLVALRGGSYVLDVYGLASADALQQRLAHPNDSAWMRPLAERHEVGLAMVYDSWFGELPPEWERVAVLSIQPFEPMAVTNGDVAIYATSPASRPAVVAALARLAPALPPGVAIVPNTVADAAPHASSPWR